MIEEDIVLTVQQPENEAPVESYACKPWGKFSVSLILCAMALCGSALASGEGRGSSSSGISAVMSSMDNVVTLCTKVWNLLTGNEYLTLFLALGLVFAGMRVFRRAKKTASR